MPPAPEVKWADLSPALQEGVRNFQKIASDNLRTDRIRVGETLCTYLIIPGIGAIKGDYDLSQNIGNQYIEQIAYDPSLAPPPKKTAAAKSSAAPAFAWPTNVTRRVLVASPATPAESVALARSAQARGFTELWLQVSLADPVASARLLDAGVKAGTGLHIAVGASIDLLKSGGMPGEPDQNILGQTGAIFGAQAAAHEPKQPAFLSDPVWKLYFARKGARYAGWISPPDPSAVSARLVPIAHVPGLAALTLRSTVAPGWAGYSSGGDDIWANGHLGYTLQTRRAFLDLYGIDPIDIVNEHWAFQQIDWDRGFFRADGWRR